MERNEFYILYDDKRIHWFSRKDKADKRNLRAIKNQIDSLPNITGKEVSLSTAQEIIIKRMLLKPSKEVVFILETEKPPAKPISFPEDLL